MFDEVKEIDDQDDICILVTDFYIGRKSINFPEDATIRRFASLRSDIHVVINAPEGFNPADAGSCCVFFIESGPRVRQLGETHYQIIYEGSDHDKAGFYPWASSCTEFFMTMHFNVGIVCADFHDFLTALHFCKGKTLRFERLTYDHHSTVPYHKHTGPEYRVIYGCLSGGNDLSLGHYLDFEEALQANNSQLVMIKSAMKFTKDCPPAMMLLGEAAN